MDALSDFPEYEEDHEGTEADGDFAGGGDPRIACGEGGGALGGACGFGGGVEEPAEPFAFLDGELILVELGEDGEGLAQAVIGGEGGGDDGLLGGGEESWVDGGGAVFHFEESGGGFA